MKKLFLVLQVFALAFCFVGTADASGGHGKKKGHHKFKHRYVQERVYYVPAPPPPAPYYAAPAPRPVYPAPNRRSTSGLAGSVVGGAVGYELGNGNPLAAGVGAAAGSLIGNKIGR